MLPLLLVLAASPTSLSFSSDGTCGDERAIRDAISVRLGRDPFRDGSTGPRFVATITKDGAGWASNLSVDGGLARRRTSTDCRELTQSLALAIAVVLELAPAQPPEPAPTAAAAPRVQFSAGGALFGSAGLSPHLTAGAALHAGLSFGVFLAEAELRLDVPAALTVGSVTITSLPALVSLSPGVELGLVRLRVPLSAGVLFVQGASGGTSPLALGGLEAALSFKVGDQWSIEPFVRVQASFIRVTVLSGTSTAWATWPVVGSAGLAVRHDFSSGSGAEERESTASFQSPAGSRLSP